MASVRANEITARRAQNTWIRTGRRILRQVKDQLESRLGPEDRSVKHYGEAFDREVKRPWSLSNKSALIEVANQADIIFGADFHAFAQSQRLHLRILRSLDSRPRVLALECIESRFQYVVDAYMKAKITDAEFCEAVGWSHNWGFSWSHYRPLFEFARTHNLTVLALNRGETSRTEASLRRRDLHAAELLVQSLRAHPRTSVYVIFGDLHLAAERLPNEFLKRWHRGKRQTSIMEPSLLTIFQNVDEVFFRLAKRGHALTTNVVRRGTRTFCVLNAPPWVKWQSYLLFLEHAFDLSAGEEEDLDYTDHVITLGKMLLDHLGIRRELNDLSVYSASSLSVIDTFERHLSARELAIAKRLMEANRGFFVPRGGVMYIGRPTLNQAATLFGHYIQARLSHRERLVWRMPQDFTRLIWLEALGFFTSKLLNHQRKPESLDSLQSKAGATRSDRDVLYLVLDHSVRELAWLSGRPLRRAKFKPRQNGSYFEAARVLGSLLGEQLFVHFHLGEATVAVEWFRQDVDDPDFPAWYKRTVSRLKPLPQILRRHRDHL